MISLAENPFAYCCQSQPSVHVGGHRTVSSFTHNTGQLSRVNLRKAQAQVRIFL